MQKEVVQGVAVKSDGSQAGPVGNLAGAAASASQEQFGVPLLSVEQVAQKLGVSPAWVRDHATRKQPHLKRVKVGKLLKFQPDDIDEFIKQWCQ